MVRLIEIIQIFLTISIAASSAQVKTLSKTHQFQGNNFIFQRFSFENTTLFYALCDQAKDVTEKQCSVVREVNAFDNSSDTSYCDLSLKTSSSNTVIDNELLIVAFGSDKTILVWLEKDKSLVELDIITEVSLKLTVVQMSNCQTTEATMNFEADKTTIDNYSIRLDFITYSDTYELVAKNLSVCSDVSIDRYCRLTYDADGNQVAGPVAWFTPLFEEIEYVASVAPRSPHKGYLLLDNDEGSYHVYLVKSNGSEVLELGEDPSSDDDYWITGFSAANDMIGICYHGDSKFTCWQYEQSGKLKLIMEFRSGSMHENLRGVVMHNLRDGGFLMMTINCPNLTCRGVSDRYYLTKVNEYTRLSGPHEIDRIVCDDQENSAWAQFFQNDNDEYCLARLCWRNGNHARLDVLTQCYSEDFFRWHR